MHLIRSSTIVATVLALAAGAHVVACGSDDANLASPGDTPDAAGSPQNTADASPPVAVGPTLTISNTRAKIYLGQTAKLDGAAIAPEIIAKHAWTVVAAPSDSAVKNDSLQGATTASPAVKPDRLGLFTLQLSGETKDGAAASVLVHVEAIDAPVFFRDLHMRGEPTGSAEVALRSSTQVAGVWGSEARELGCPLSLVYDAGGIEALIRTFLTRAGASNGDTWEGPPGTPARVVFPSIHLDIGVGTASSTLDVATSQSACGASDAKSIVSSPEDAGLPSGSPENLVYSARFSPDGNRIAYLHDIGGVARLATIGFDGADRRDLSVTRANGDGGLVPDGGNQLAGSFPNVLGPVAPRWRDATHVGWVAFIGDETQRADWELWAVEDKAGATPELVMRCNGSTLSHFDFLPNGTIVAAVRHTHTTDAGDTSPRNLLVYGANPTTKACEVVRNLTNHTRDQDVARDFALSPDKSMVAFYAGVGNGLPGDLPPATVTALYTVPVDGSQPAAPVPGGAGSTELGIGPRWAAGGTVITWSQLDLSASTGGGGLADLPSSRIVAVPAAGGAIVHVANSTSDYVPDQDGGAVKEYHLRYGVGQGCGMAPGPISKGVVVAFGALGVVTLVARRRRASKQ